MEKEYIGYVFEKLYLAVNNLARDAGNINERIYNIYYTHLFTLECELKEERLKNFVNKMNEYSKENGCYAFDDMIKVILKNNVGMSLSAEQADEIAKTIFSLYNYVLRIDLENHNNIGE